MEKHGYHHLFSDGFRTDHLFEDRTAFIAGMNIVACSFLKSDVVIIAFCLMDNHVHFILYGTLGQCIGFRDRFIHHYSVWYSNQYCSQCPKTLNFDIKHMDDERYILTSIAYVLRNSIAAGFSFCPEDYLWSSSGLYFRNPEKISSMTSCWKMVSEMTVRERRQSLRTRMDIPHEWLITSEGFIWPGNYVDYKRVESLYRSPKSFAYFMGQKKEDEINDALGIYDAVFLPDIELREKAVARCSVLFATTDLRQLDVRGRLILAKELRKEYRCSPKQIARIIHLDPKYIKELV